MGTGEDSQVGLVGLLLLVVVDVVGYGDDGGYAA
jgi:hypothetical protein